MMKVVLELIELVVKLESVGECDGVCEDGERE